MSIELIVMLVVLGAILLGGGVALVVTRGRPQLPAGERPDALGEGTPEKPGKDLPRQLESRPPSAVEMPVEKPREGLVAAREAAEARQLEQRERLRKGLARTRGGFVARLSQLLRGKPRVDDDLKDDVEEVLFTADIGATTAQKLLDRVTESLDRSQIAEPDAVWSVIRESMLGLLSLETKPLDFDAPPRPYVLLMIGVNGVGKTTTLGKLASRHAAAGRKVLLVAGDTFRAAAGEQLEVWSRRVGCGFFAAEEGADPSSVIFDGIMHGHREGYDMVLCDTAGRLHTKETLMAELQKIRRTCAKALRKAAGDDAASDAIDGPHDTFLVLDATIGQNALMQAQHFKNTMDFTGLVVTKLDGTAKGGVTLGVVDELQIPVRYIGIGEGVEDLREFDAEAFCDALLDRAED